MIGRGSLQHVLDSGHLAEWTAAAYFRLASIPFCKESDTKLCFEAFLQTIHCFSSILLLLWLIGKYGVTLARCRGERLVTNLGEGRHSGSL